MSSLSVRLRWSREVMSCEDIERRDSFTATRCIMSISTLRNGYSGDSLLKDGTSELTGGSK